MHEASDLGRCTTSRVKAVCTSCCTGRGGEAVSFRTATDGPPWCRRQGFVFGRLSVAEGEVTEVRELESLWRCIAGSVERPSPGTTSPLQGWTSSWAVGCRRSEYVPLHLLPPYYCMLSLNKERNATGRLPGASALASLSYHAQDVESASR